MSYTKKSRPEESSISFYVAGSNRDLLQKIDQLMADSGLIGLRDAQGHYHYLIEGRKGAPYATRRIHEITAMEQSAKTRNVDSEIEDAEFYVDAVLSCYRFNTMLKGYAMLRYILISNYIQPALGRSLSKILYPRTARAFRATVSQVERNLRYALDMLKEAEISPKWHPMERQVVFREGAPAYMPSSIRELAPGVEHYGNAMAITTLSAEVKKLSDMDKHKDSKDVRT